MNGLLKVPGYLEPHVNQLIAIETGRADFMSRPSVMLGVKPKQDGDQWCAMLGDNLMENVAGFGDAPDKAMMAFDSAWYKSAGKETK
jgi:hypothetical protein